LIELKQYIGFNDNDI